MNKRGFAYIHPEQLKYENISCGEITKNPFFEYQYNNNTKERLRIITPMIKCQKYCERHYQTGRICLQDTDEQFLKPFFDEFSKWIRQKSGYDKIVSSYQLRLIKDKYSDIFFTKIIKYNVNKKYDRVEIHNNPTKTIISKILSDKMDYRMVLQPRIFFIDKNNIFLQWQIYIMEISYPGAIFESVIDKNSQELPEEIEMIEI